jgi:acylphosphatase
MSENKQYRLHAYISGRVQGVGFRFHILQAAKEHNLMGWVRNLRDGRVEVTAEGDHESLNRLLAALHNGPVSAEVEQVDYAFNDAEREFSQFRVRGTP